MIRQVRSNPAELIPVRLGHQPVPRLTNGLPSFLLWVVESRVGHVLRRCTSQGDLSAQTCAQHLHLVRGELGLRAEGELARGGHLLRSALEGRVHPLGLRPVVVAPSKSVCRDDGVGHGDERRDSQVSCLRLLQLDEPDRVHRTCGGVVRPIDRVDQGPSQ